MGFEDEVEQSLGRRCHLSDGRFKRTYELTSSIIPRRTSFHRSVELDCSLIAFDPEGFSCRCDLSGPAELGAVNPDAVHDHGQPARQRDPARSWTDSPKPPGTFSFHLSAICAAGASWLSLGGRPDAAQRRQSKRSFASWLRDQMDA